MNLVLGVDISLMCILKRLNFLPIGNLKKRCSTLWKGIATSLPRFGIDPVIRLGMGL